MVKLNVMVEQLSLLLLIYKVLVSNPGLRPALQTVFSCGFSLITFRQMLVWHLKRCHFSSLPSYRCQYGISSDVTFPHYLQTDASMASQAMSLFLITFRQMLVWHLKRCHFSSLPSDRCQYGISSNVTFPHYLQTDASMASQAVTFPHYLQTDASMASQAMSLFLITFRQMLVWHLKRCHFSFHITLYLFFTKYSII